MTAGEIFYLCLTVVTFLAFALSLAIASWLEDRHRPAGED